MDQSTRDRLQNYRKLSLVVAAAAGALSILGFFTSRTDFAYSYLIAFLFWFAITIGSMPLIMIHHLTAGGWGQVTRRILEIFLKNVPLLLLAFVPVVFCMKELYIWTHADLVQHDKILQAKQYYLNVPFFLGRAGVYFLLWFFFSWVLCRGSLEYDRTGNAAVKRRLAAASGIGLVVYSMTSSFAGIDWTMTLDPYWFSTIYGAFYMVGNGVAAFAAAIVTARFLTDLGPLRPVMNAERSHDLGKLLFAFIMLWAYMHLSQFIIVWSGNLPEETPWYMRRFRNGWTFISLMVTFFHFAIPFLILLSRDLKRNIHAVSIVAGVILFMHWVEIFLFVKPVHYERLSFHWLDLTCTLALGGLFKFFILGAFLKEPLTFSDDPCLTGAEAHHE